MSVALKALSLLVTAAPAVRDAVMALLSAFSKKDELAVRRAIEAAQRLEFELRQELKRNDGR